MVFDAAGLQVERAADLAAGGVAVGVQNAVAAVRAFARERELGSGAIELRAPLDQLFDARRTFFDQHARGFLVDQAVAGVERVLQMQRNFVFIAEGGGDSALRVLRVGFGHLTLGEARAPGPRTRARRRRAVRQCLRQQR